MVAQENALARIERGESSIVATVKDLTAQLIELEKTANVLSPAFGAGAIKPLHAVSLRVVKIDPNPAKGEVYFDARFCRGRKDQPEDVALTKVGIMKLLQAAGVHVVESRRTDDRSDPNYCSYRAALQMEDYDGKLRQARATRACDFRDGAPDTMKKGGIKLEPDALNDKRRNIESLSETKAKLRAARDLFNLKQKYSVAELQKPWVVPVLVLSPDPNHPMDRKHLLESSQRAVARLYGAPDETEMPDYEVRNVTAEVVEEPHAPPPLNGHKPKAPESDIPEDEDLDFRDDPDDPPPDVLACACPCGCKKELSEEAHAHGVTKIGTPRCKGCYPGSAFNFNSLHPPGLDLAVPKYPGMTAGKLMETLERRGVQK
jgi:hypothetical protein